MNYRQTGFLGGNGGFYEMKEIEISGANRFETFTKTRAGSRAVILRDGMILLSHDGSASAGVSDAV